VIVRSSVQPISKDESMDMGIKDQIWDFNQLMQERIGEVDLNDIPQELQDEYDTCEPMEPESCKPEIDTLGGEIYDNLISAEVSLPVDGILVQVKVTGQKRDPNGNPVGTPNGNPILDTRVCEVTFPYGHVDEYAANIIIENMYQQVDSDGNTHLIFQEITDHRCDSSALHTGKAKTTKGWYLQVADSYHP